MKSGKIKKIVREGYAKIANQNTSCSCCGSTESAQDIGKKIGYTAEELQEVPEGTMSLGCGNPVALASLREGETVLDLGSGTGLDCFIAANKVGKNGKVIGVDMTPEMIEKARKNARKGNYRNVEFRLAEIEKLPLTDNSVNVVISNCVINLSPDKKRVFKETFRVLKPGGRLMISDIVLLKELPDSIKTSIDAYVGCLSGAMMKDDYIGAIKSAGFRNIRIMDETTFPIELIESDPTVKTVIDNLKIPREILKELASSAVSIKIHAVKQNGKET